MDGVMMGLIEISDLGNEKHADVLLFDGGHRHGEVLSMEGWRR